MTDGNHQTSDVLGYADDLRRALAQPALFDWFQSSAGDSTTMPAEARIAAYRVAAAIGYCRLFGVVLPNEVDGMLPENMAEQAAECLREKLRQWTERARHLPDEWKNAGSEYEADELALGLLALRMRAWACQVALEETLGARGDEGPDTDRLKGMIGGYRDALKTFDEKLHEQKQLLAAAKATYLLENWRTFLDDRYRRHLPWWLDGTLEALPIPVREGRQSAVAAGAAAARAVWEWMRWKFSMAAGPQLAIGFDPAQQAQPSLPRTREVTLPTGGTLVAVVYRPDGAPLTIEFRSTDLQLQGHSIELVLVQRGAEVFRGTFLLQLDAEQVLTTRHEVGTELDSSTEYDIRFGLVAPSSSGPNNEEVP